MTLMLSDEQRKALERQSDLPITVVDERTNKVYVLLPSEIYEQMKSHLEDNFDISETYPAQWESAMRAGWSDPAMDDYNNYEENRKKLCP